MPCSVIGSLSLVGQLLSEGSHTQEAQLMAYFSTSRCIIRISCVVFIVCDTAVPQNMITIHDGKLRASRVWELWEHKIRKLHGELSVIAVALNMKIIPEISAQNSSTKCKITWEISASVYGYMSYSKFSLHHAWKKCEFVDYCSCWFLQLIFFEKRKLFILQWQAKDSFKKMGYSRRF